MPPANKPRDLAETIILPSPVAESTRTSGTSMPRAEVVTGSRPQIESETEALLRTRLQAAALVLCVAVGLFFIRSFFLSDAPVRWMQGLVAIILGSCVLWLRNEARLSLKQLRALEIGIFGLASLYLACFQYAIVQRKAEAGNDAFALAAIKSNVMYVFGVIMLYGTFIPNTWKRTAAVVFPMALVPGLMMVFLQFRSGAVRAVANHVGTFEQISDNGIILIFGAVAATIGAHTINKLRQVAFKARQLGQYRLKDKIGGGGMGEVYLAEHQLLKRPCAIKLIRPGTQADRAALARFEREVRTTAKLSHWNTIDIFDYGHTEDGTFYYVMEYLPGLSLADLVKRYGPLAPARAVHLLRQTCQALREAHNIGLVHRDIKPANVFAAIRGGVYDVAKLLDFGLVRPVESDTADPGLTQEGGFTGTPLFMSPEQGTSQQVLDPRSDIYSLGATAYFLLTGQAPFPGSNVVQVLLAHARDPVPPLTQFNAAVPADLEKIVMRCLEKDPASRYPDIESLEKALANCSVAGQWSDEDAARWWLETEGVLPGSHGSSTLPETAHSP